MIRFADETDIPALNELFEAVFDKQRADETVQWKFFEHPVADNPWVLVFEEEGELLGSISLWVNQAYIEGELKKIALRCDTMVHPHARGRGIYAQLNARMLNEAKQSGIAMLYGFPSEKAKHPLIKQTNALDLGGVLRYVWIQKPVTLLAKKFKPFYLFKPIEVVYQKMKRRGLQNSQENVYEIAEFDKRIAPLVSQFKYSKAIVPNRDVSYLNWRYTNHPTNHYRVFVYEQAGEWLGYIVLGENSIVDVVAVGDAEVWDQLVNTAKYQLKDAPFIQTWTMPNNPLEVTLKRTGFTKKDEPMPFVVNPLDIEEMERDDIYLVQGDVDSF